jgi:hypothetical protein
MNLWHAVAMTKRLVLVMLLAAACSKKAPATTTTANSGGGDAPAAPAGILKDLQNGDRACYVILEVDGQEQSIEGDFDLCAGGPKDATALVGKRVTYTTERANVQAASCQGDPDCSDSDAVDLVVTITAAP